MFTLTPSNCKVSLQTRHKSYACRDPESVAQAAPRLKNPFSDSENSPDILVPSEGEYGSRQNHTGYREKDPMWGPPMSWEAGGTELMAGLQPSS